MNRLRCYMLVEGVGHGIPRLAIALKGFDLARPAEYILIRDVLCRVTHVEPDHPQLPLLRVQPTDVRKLAQAFHIRAG